ncbi:MAG: tripartite tricarboxylate transporter substrate binding protein [Burkholderiales bacterium]|nr:tripartite tricarboxylate transporter substrate binding protein [Burkholderiales bacterium]
MARFAAALPFVMMLTAPGAALAQSEYPVKPVRLIVPSSPGGGTDTIGRFLAHYLAAALGQQFVIDNRAGAAGLIGYNLAVRAPADGYTLVIAPTSITSLHLVYRNSQFNAELDFAPISQIVASAQALVVHPSVPARSLKELVALAGKSAGDLAYASPGEGSVPHLAVEQLKMMAGIDLRHVPYKGVAPGLTDVVGGRVAAMIVNVISAKPHVDGGRLTAVAVTSLKRVEAMPAVPTVAESGYPGYEALQWFGLFAPAGTPRAVISRLNQLTVAALREPEAKKRLAGEDPIGNSPEEFAKVIKAEVARWTKVARAAKLEPR